MHYSMLLLSDTSMLPIVLGCLILCRCSHVLLLGPTFFRKLFTEHLSVLISETTERLSKTCSELVDWVLLFCCKVLKTDLTVKKNDADFMYQTFDTEFC